MKNEIYVNFRDGNSILAKVLFDCVNIVFDCSITYQKKKYSVWLCDKKCRVCLIDFDNNNNSSECMNA